MCASSSSPRRSQRLSIDDAGRHGYVELASEPLELRIGSGLIQLVRFRRHDEIVAVQAPDLVGPPGDRRSAPFGQQRRVMPLCLCKLALPSS
jgi:hypothetical protein